MTTQDPSGQADKLPQSSMAARSITVLNPAIALPEFALFQVVKVKTTKEIGTIVGIWCVQTEEQSYQWLYRLEGLTECATVWWQEMQLRSLDRRGQR